MESIFCTIETKFTKFCITKNLLFEVFYEICMLDNFSFKNVNLFLINRKFQKSLID